MATATKAGRIAKSHNQRTPMWTLEEGLALVRELQPLAHEIHYHVAIGGGVVNNGNSCKDLDLYFLPFDNEPDVDEENLRVLLRDQLGNYSNINSSSGSDRSWATHYSLKRKYNYNGRRIDVFVMPTRSS